MQNVVLIKKIFLQKLKYFAFIKKMLTEKYLKNVNCCVILAAEYMNFSNVLKCSFKPISFQVNFRGSYVDNSRSMSEKSRNNPAISGKLNSFSFDLIKNIISFDLETPNSDLKLLVLKH